MYSPIVRWSEDGSAEIWTPVTLDQINRDERFLEDVLFRTPELLCLQSRRTGVRPPFVVLRQVSFSTPQGRQIVPDLVVLSSSGDLIIVEVKLFVNPELSDRRVIAQVVDYAASFSALREVQLVSIFGRGQPSSATWVDVVHHLFPNEDNTEELAGVFLSNIHAGNIHILIACDRTPRGLNEIVRGVAAQSVLGFILAVLEITPYVKQPPLDSRILFVPSTRLATEIVARTAITLTYPKEGEQPSISVETTSIEEIEMNIASATEGGTMGMVSRDWSDVEIEEAFLTGDDPTLRDLFLFAKEHSTGGRLKSSGPRKAAGFGFYVLGLKADGTEHTTQVFNCSINYSRVVIYLNMTAPITPAEVFESYRQKLFSMFGSCMKSDAKEPNVPISLVGEHLEEFKQVILWLQSMLDPRAKA